MNARFFSIAILFCSLNNQVLAQNKTVKKRSMLAYNINFSDYNFVRMAKDSSFNAAFKQKNRFKSGNSSFGLGVSYWKGLNSYVDFTGNFAGTFSNFPAGFVKNDSIGQAGFSSQLDALLHVRALKEKATINPFITGGVGLGFFAKQLAVYAPLGAGLQFHFNDGVYIFVQAQWRMALTTGINNDYMFYSIGLAQQAKLSTKQKKPNAKKELPAKELENKKTAVKDADTDGDGVTDLKDNCPTEKGTVYGCPDLDGDAIADKDDKCRDVAGVLRYDGCPVPDTDGDGLNDEIDKCKTEKGPGKNHGCPLPDADEDGVLDNDDKCPSVKGTVENKGCPMPVADAAELIAVSEDSMTYRINFDFDRAILLPDAFTVLKQIVDILKADNSLQINITGHADNLGTMAGNMQVSAERAKIARDYFLSYGIAAGRIKFANYGANKPIDNIQQWRNRRVEITISKK